MYIQLRDRRDRLGSQITNYVAQIAIAINHKAYIQYDRATLWYNESLFVTALFDYIDIYNKTLPVEDLTHEYEHPAVRNPDWCYTMSQAVQMIQQDLVSFVHNYTSIRSIFQPPNYVLPFDPKRTILVHLRLDDVANRQDYNGHRCANFYRERLHNGIDCLDTDAHSIVGYEYNRQAPISNEKLQRQIDMAKATYPFHTVKLLSSPNAQSQLPYELLSHPNPDYDLYLLSVCDVVILSRSTFSISALLFGNHTAAYVPIWGHFVCCGLDTRYDKKRYHYFY
jgi:hypothetical protein